MSLFKVSQKVVCIDNTGIESRIEQGKTYTVAHVGGIYIRVTNSEGYCDKYSANRFMDLEEYKAMQQADTSANSVDEPKFKVGDRVYNTFDVKIRTIDEINDDVVSFKDGGSCVARICVHATPENHALLSQLYPHIEFESPPKELTGSDLCRAIKSKGKQFVLCATSDKSEEDALQAYYNKAESSLDVIYRIDDDCFPFVAVWGNSYKFAVPINEETGEPLTEAVLDES